MKKAANILKVLAVNSSILIISLVILELIFGGWLNTDRLNRLNLLRDCNIKFDASKLYETTKPIITYSRDSYGLRGTHNTPSSINILTVGGSTTDQRYISNGETWQDILQDKFFKSGKKIFIGNAGVDGQSTFGHIKNFKWWFPNIPGLAPDFILFYVGLNDYHKNIDNPYDLLLDKDKKKGVIQNIKDNSAIIHLARTIRGAYRALIVSKIGHYSVDFSKLPWTKTALQEDYSFTQPRLEAYAARLRILAEMTIDFGARPIFVTQPSRKYKITSSSVQGLDHLSTYEDNQINGLDFYNIMRYFDKVLESVATEYSAIYIDLASHPGWEDDDFYDYAHMTPGGAYKVGELLYEELKSIQPSEKRTNMALSPGL